MYNLGKCCHSHHLSDQHPDTTLENHSSNLSMQPFDDLKLFVNRISDLGPSKEGVDVLLNLLEEANETIMDKCQIDMVDDTLEQNKNKLFNCEDEYEGMNFSFSLHCAHHQTNVYRHKLKPARTRKRSGPRLGVSSLQKRRPVFSTKVPTKSVHTTAKCYICHPSMLDGTAKISIRSIEESIGLTAVCMRQQLQCMAQKEPWTSVSPPRISSGQGLKLPRVIGVSYHRFPRIVFHH